MVGTGRGPISRKPAADQTTPRHRSKAGVVLRIALISLEALASLSKLWVFAALGVFSTKLENAVKEHIRLIVEAGIVLLLLKSGRFDTSLLNPHHVPCL